MEEIVKKVTDAVVYKLQLPTQSPAQDIIRSENEIDAGAGDSVQGSVEAVLGNISGESNMPLEMPRNVFVSTEMPIGLVVPAKIKSKILANEYIDFRSLITNHAKANASYRLNVSEVKDIPGTSALTLEPNVKIKFINSIETWTTAFHIFVAIYTKQYPNEAPDLMKYGEIIRDLASRGFHWRYYDENFRLMRQGNPKLYPWNKMHSELWIRSQPPVNSKSNVRIADGG